jgi:hypothetical protein
MACVTMMGVGAAAALGLGLGHSIEPGEKEVDVISSANAKYLGRAKCSLRGAFFRSMRNATLLGDLLVVSRTPGTAEAALHMQGVEVEHDAFAVSVMSQAGAPMVKFWLQESEEAAQWAEALRAVAHSSVTVPKLLSLKIVQPEQLKANRCESGISDEQVSKLEQELHEKESETALLTTKLEGLGEVPEMLSLDRKEIAEVQVASEGKDKLIAALQIELEAEINCREVTQESDQTVSTQAEHHEIFSDCGSCSDGTLETLEDDAFFLGPAVGA